MSISWICLRFLASLSKPPPLLPLPHFTSLLSLSPPQGALARRSTTAASTTFIASLTPTAARTRHRPPRSALRVRFSNLHSLFQLLFFHLNCYTFWFQFNCSSLLDLALSGTGKVRRAHVANKNASNRNLLFSQTCSRASSKKSNQSQLVANGKLDDSAKQVRNADTE